VGCGCVPQLKKSGEGAVSLSKIFLDFCVKMKCFVAFWHYFE